ncbi:MAG: RagB/SusD family nutrient uptake outer membrane protein [Pigmentiphaga sp.]|nr:RagB/SusD family nutrient uptake outer membrane protein [Pigmentiphaga sp.]
MKLIKKIFFLVFLINTLFACDSFLAPDKDNIFSESELIKDPSKAEGVLLNAYQSVPNSVNFTEVATDDAVSNDNSNNYRQVSSGGWAATNNPFNTWAGSYTNITYINLFLTIVDKVEWSEKSDWQNEHYKLKLKAEAYGLRALFQYRLLQAHSGMDNSGNLLGYPITTKLITVNDDWQSYPRASYEDCVNQILADLEIAISGLPDTYADAPINDALKADYDKVYGSRFLNRMNKRAAQLLKARVLLHAASPAFNLNNDLKKWESAADAAAVVIEANGGLNSLSNNRLQFYLNENNTDIIWRKDYNNSRNLEVDHFPPSLYGTGRLNPTQNLVDAFPTADGYPINNPASAYDNNNPYSNRDPRLGTYIVYNSSKLKNATINTVNDTKDGVNMIAESSTRTGYYMKKLLNENVNLTPGLLVSQRHFQTLMRVTEAFLIYAEAANEAWGPDGKGSNNYSSKEIIKSLRTTAGITTDNYLPTVNNKDDMRELVRNERRIELAFEGFRFWDIRRWNDITLMKKTAQGTLNGGVSAIDVENRAYEDYMIYGPIPDSEHRKGLVQNKGWQ